MMNNKHGPYLGFTATRGDPDIGRFKRGRAPCPSSLITLLLKRKAGVADGLDANCLTQRIMLGWERYALSLNAVRSSTLTGLKKTRELSVYVVTELGMIRDLSACVAPDSVKVQNGYATLIGLNRCAKNEHVRISFNAVRSSTLTGLKKTRDLSVYVVTE